MLRRTPRHILGGDTRQPSLDEAWDVALTSWVPWLPRRRRWRYVCSLVSAPAAISPWASVAVAPIVEKRIPMVLSFFGDLQGVPRLSASRRRPWLGLVLWIEVKAWRTCRRGAVGAARVITVWRRGPIRRTALLELVMIWRLWRVWKISTHLVGRLQGRLSVRVHWTLTRCKER
jgi:hypothetical protein